MINVGIANTVFTLQIHGTRIPAINGRKYGAILFNRHPLHHFLMEIIRR